MLKRDGSGNRTRRDVLKTVGAASLGATALGTRPVAADDRYDYEFETVIDMVEAGADPTGEEPVDPLIEDLIGDDTLLYFPEGRYKLEQYRNYEGTNENFESELYTRYENFGLKGAGSGKTYLVPRDGHGSEKFGSGYFDKLWFELRYGRNYLVEGFTLDYTAENTGGRFQLLPDSGFVVRDVRVKGFNDVEYGPFLFSVFQSGGHGLVDRVRAPDGGSIDTPSSGPVGMFIPPSTRGTITVRNCHLEGFSDNGLYASNVSSPGAVQVVGGYFANNNISQVRLGTPESFVKNAHIEVNRVPEFNYTTNMRGIRAADGAGVSVKNCEVVMTADAPSEGAIVATGTAPGLTVENTRIRVDSPYTNYAIHGKSAGDDRGDTFRNVRITGDGTGTPAVNLVDRPNATFEGVCLDQTGDDRDGIQFVRSDAAVSNSVVDVTGVPIVAEDSEVSTHNVRYEGNCANSSD